MVINPAVSVSETSDSTGIIVAGLRDDNHGYIIDDLFNKYSPEQWAVKAVSAYKRYGADRIVAEKNQGGLMVESTLRAVDRSVPVRLVNASRGKYVRAEPVSALSEETRLHHVGCFPELEDEMCSFEPGSTDSPDRMDAMVWAITDLMLGWNQQYCLFHAPVTGLPRSQQPLDHGSQLPGAVAPYGGSIQPGHELSRGWRRRF